MCNLLHNSASSPLHLIYYKNYKTSETTCLGLTGKLAYTMRAVHQLEWSNNLSQMF